MQLFYGLGLLLLATLSGCQYSAPPCPINSNSKPAVSAGCLVTNNKQLLVIEGFNNKLSIPGGSGNPLESPECTAHRETWEETGFNVHPKKLIKVMDNGFHLYHCQLNNPADDIDPPFRLEVRRAFWITPQIFSDYEWRFPEQKAMLAKWMKEYQNANAASE